MFIKNYTPESVYILGLLWADGTINKKTNSFSLECVKEDIDYFYPIFQTTGEYGLYTRNRPNRKEQGTIAGTSLELSTFLKENDYTKKSVLSPNKILSKIPNDLKRYFFLGWSDGDGCFYGSKKCNQFCMSGSYEQDWSELIKKCVELNIHYRIDRKITKLNNTYSVLRICRRRDVIKFGNYIYQDLKLGLKRKYEKLNIIKAFENNRPKFKIICMNEDDTIINDFDSLTLASKWINMKKNVSGSINDVCVGRQKTAYGYKWKKLCIN